MRDFGGDIDYGWLFPLILLNELIATVNVNLPADQQIKSFGLFDVTPIGLALVATGILYFMICGRFLLPKNKMESASAQSMKDYMKRVYGIKADICEVRIPEGNLLIGEAIGDIMEAHHIYVIGYYHRGSKIFPPVLTRPIEAPCRLAILGRRKVVAEMVADYGLELLPGLEVFAEDVAPTKSGVAEIVTPPDSNVIGKSARDLLLRQTYGQSLLAIHRGSDVFSHVETEEHESSRVGTIPLQGGDTIVVHLMSAIAVSIVKYGGRTEKRIIPIVSGVVGLISSFMQNVGAAALFLPVVSRISARTEIPINRLLMPMGFCAILGGTLTMVGSSPLILLNDLIATVNVNLPADQQIKSFGLFDVTPIGLALVATGILYFMICGRFLLPKNKMESASAQSMKDYMKRVYGIKADICEVRIPEGNLLIGEAIGDIMEAHHIYVIGYYHRGSKIFPPVLTRPIEAPCRLAILGRRKVVAEMVADYGLELLPGLEVFAEDVAPTKSGVAEIVIPPIAMLSVNPPVICYYGRLTGRACWRFIEAAMCSAMWKPRNTNPVALALSPCKAAIP